METVTCRKVSAFHPDAVDMRQKLSRALEVIVGNSGRNSFSDWQDDDELHTFIVAYCDKRAVGCGGLRPLTAKTGEIKRMYADGRGGVGSLILNHLERIAGQQGFERLQLETREVNLRAISFYHAQGYQPIAAYGRYIGRADARCFEKMLAH